jgi:hypothetical protein
VARRSSCVDLPSPKTLRAPSHLSPRGCGKNETSKIYELEKCLAEAVEQQTATAEILKVISTSPTDVQPVFDAIAAAALKLCRATLANVFRYDGELIHLVAVSNANVDRNTSLLFIPLFPGRLVSIPQPVGRSSRETSLQSPT